MDERAVNDTEQAILKAIDDRREEIIAFARDIYDHAELGYKEFETSAKFKAKMEALGLKVQDQLAITGLKARLNEEKHGTATVALIGELDALRIPAHAHVNPQTEAAHCCGHHAQLAAVFGAALALTVPEIREKLDGEVIFFATPAEEYGEVEFKNELRAQGKIKYGGGKCELLRIGAFDDIDLCLAHHSAPGAEILLGNGSGNGFVSKVVTIKGRAAHAAGAPEKGVNALSAASLGLQALGLNRETFRDEDAVRVHPIVTKGGSLVNVIPDEVKIESLVRAKTIEAFGDAAAKFDRSFKAGALALGAETEIVTLPGYLPTLKEEPLPEFYQAAALAAPGVKTGLHAGHSGGSTDLGDVQHLMPVYTFRTGGIQGGLHQADFAVTDEDLAYIAAAKIFALTAFYLLKDGARRAKELKAAYRPRFKTSREYAAYMDGFDKTERFGVLS